MGQYYTLTCPDTGSYFSARDLGSFIKAWEQVWSVSMPAALAFACSAGRGTHPRDLPWAPQGLWAGRMPLMIGDYAKSDDLIGREDRMASEELELYLSCHDKEICLVGKVMKRKRLLNLSTAFTPILERALSLRIADVSQDGEVIRENPKAHTLSMASLIDPNPKTVEMRCGNVMSHEDPMPFPVTLCRAQIIEQNYTESIHPKLGTEDGSWEAADRAFVTSVTVYRKDLPLFPDEVVATETSFAYRCPSTD